MKSFLQHLNMVNTIYFIIFVVSGTEMDETMTTQISSIVTNSVVRPQQQLVTLVTDVMKWMYLLVGILGIVCNLFVLVVIARSNQMRQQPRNWLIFMQSFSDFFGAIFLITVTFRVNSTQLEVDV